MYHAKAAGRNRFAIFDADSASRCAWRDVQRDLHHALSRNELLLHHQPICRWPISAWLARRRSCAGTSQARNPLSNAFLELAEQSGLILPIGRWALQTAAHQASSWACSMHPESRSGDPLPRQLADEELIPAVVGALSANRLPAQRLCLEVGETAIIGVHRASPAGCASCARSASRSPSTTSAPGTPPSVRCWRCRSTRSAPQGVRVRLLIR